jgi:hypothetical protein
MISSLKIIETWKAGRRVTGALYATPKGAKLYLAHRSLNQIFRSGELTISAAVAKGVACWALDETTLLMLRVKQIMVAGVLVKDNGDLWLASYHDFMDQTKALRLTYEHRNGAMQRYLPLQFFTHRPGRVKL